MTKFMVSRTSGRIDEKPCDEAGRLPYVRVDVRSTDDPAKIPAHKGQPANWWYEHGRNHRVEDGYIMRDFDDEAWFVDLKSLEELLAFGDKHGDIILSVSWYNADIRSIEIYDDYRE